MNFSREIERAPRGTAIATPGSVVLKKLVSLAVPASLAASAFLHARAIGSLIEAGFANGTESATTAGSPILPSVANANETTSSTMSSSAPGKSAGVILDRNVFDHVTGSLRPSGTAVATAASDEDTFANVLLAPSCDGVRAVVTMRAADATASFASFDVGGKRVLQKRGGDIEASTRVVYIGEDRVWLTKNGALCQARVFDRPGASGASLGQDPQEKQKPSAVSQQSPLEKEVAKKIVKTGPNEFQIDRGAVNMILEAQTELMKTPLVPEKEGDHVVGFRLVKIKPGSVLATLGLESNDRLVALNGIEVTSTERMLEAYARMRSGTIDRFTINIVRNGKPTNIDYVVR